MGKIYSTADSTLAYLGHGREDIGRVLDRLGNDTYSTGYSDIKLLDGLSYFNRQWIEQEMVLSRGLVLLYGSRRCPWRVIEEIYGDRLVASRLSRLWRSSLGMPREGLMLNFRDGACSDAHNRIYAVLALYSGGSLFPMD